MSDPINLISLIASIASLILAVVAIVLSIVFFVLGLKQANDARNASSSIEGSVSRLETLFDRLYSDTFSIVKKTMDDMSSHIWRREDVPESSPDEAAETAELLDNMKKVSEEVGIAHDKIRELQERMGPVVRESVSDMSNRIPVRVRVLRYLSMRKRSNRQDAQLADIISALERYDISDGDIVAALFKMREGGRVTWDGDDGSLALSTRITLLDSPEKSSGGR